MTLWQTAARFPTLHSGSIDVWLADTEALAACTRRFESLLDDEELARRDAFHSAADRMRHVVARGVLRSLAAHYLGLSPPAVSFHMGAHGKPRVAGASGKDLGFNVSHSGDVVLLAFVRDGDIGVDVERWNARLGEKERNDLAMSVFSNAERSALDALASADARERAFYSIWSRKEAYLKGIGTGIAEGLLHIDVSADEPARLLADRSAPSNPARWGLHDIDVGSRYSAALATCPRDQHLNLWRASPDLFARE